ncbi:MAG: DUF6265 family protein [Chthoniobacterales bacterium]
MRRLRAFTLLVIASVVFGVASSRTAAAGTIADLGWLQGCWASATSGERQTTEHWMKAAGGTMLGMNRTIAGDKTLDFEFMRIAQEGDGEIYFIAEPSGQDKTRFKLIKNDKREAIFENPTHDFPQRVIYRRQDDGSLHGRIEGEIKGQGKAVDFPMRKIPCD